MMQFDIPPAPGDDSSVRSALSLAGVRPADIPIGEPANDDDDPPGAGAPAAVPPDRILYATPPPPPWPRIFPGL